VIGMDLKGLLERSRHKIWKSPEERQAQRERRWQLQRIWEEAQPEIVSHDYGSDADIWDKKTVFMRNAMQEGFTPEQISRFLARKGEQNDL